MREKLRFLGMDVHAETIAVAVAEPDGEVRSLGTIANREDSIRKFIRKLGSPEHLRACYEAGPTGFVLYWQLTQLGVKCDVIAPSLVPKKPGDKVKTDRRDALKLARSHRSGDLTAVWIPDEASEALRDLVRAREAAKQRSFASTAPADEVPAAYGPASSAGSEGVDGTSCGVASAGSLHTSCAGSNVARLSARSSAHGRTSQAIGKVDCGSDSAGSRVDAGSNSWLTGIARHRAPFGSHDGCRAGQHHLPLRVRSGSDGVKRSISGRKLQRQAYSKRRHYQVWQRAPPTNHCRIGLELSTPASGRSQVTQAPGRTASRDYRDCMESAEPSAQALHGADGSRQGAEKDHDGDRARTVGLYLGHRDQGRSDGLQTTNGGMTRTERTKAKTFQIRKKQKQINP